MFEGRVKAIFIGPEAGKPMTSVDDVRAVSGRGLEGDRYFSSEGTFSKTDPDSRQITLIESEGLAAARRSYDVDIEPIETRRNVLTEGVPLNHLVDREFEVGGVRLRGVKLCEPCGHLARMTGKNVVEALAHRGGLRAQILTTGTIRVGDRISPASMDSKQVSDA